MPSKKSPARRRAAVGKAREVEIAKPALGSGAPVGLSLKGVRETVGEPEEGSLAVRLQRLQEEHDGGLVERQPVGVVDGKMKYRFVMHLNDGTVISGKGDSSEEQVASLEKRLKAWRDSE